MVMIAPQTLFIIWQAATRPRKSAITTAVKLRALRSTIRNFILFMNPPSTTLTDWDVLGEARQKAPLEPGTPCATLTTRQLQATEEAQLFEARWTRSPRNMTPPGGS